MRRLSRKEGLPARRGMLGEREAATSRRGGGLRE